MENKIKITNKQQLGKTKYKVNDNVIPNNKFDADIKRASSIISDIVGIEEPKVQFFISTFGIEKILKEPSIMGITVEQEEKLKQLKDILELAVGGAKHESI